MTIITNPFIDTGKLERFAFFLRHECKKIIDALFVENLITAIKQHPGADKSCIDRWLKSAFSFKANFENNNDQDIYNMSLYHQILEKLQ